MSSAWLWPESITPALQPFDNGITLQISSYLTM